MQMQFQKSILKCLRLGAQEVKNTELTQEIRLGEGMPDIGRVLATWGQCLLRSKQWQGDTIEISGGVKTWTLYMPEEGTEPRVVECWLPFQQRWDVDSDDRTGSIRVMPLLRYADSRGISSRKIMLRAGVGILCQAFLPMEAEVFSPGELPEDVALLRRTYPMRLPVEAGEKAFLLDEEAELPFSDPGWKLLCGLMSPEISDQRVMNDKIVLKGNVKLQLLCRNQEGTLRQMTVELPFSQLADLDTTHGAHARADIQMGVTELEFDRQENGQLRVKCGLVSQYLIDEEQDIDVIEDAYSPHRQIRPEMQQLQIPVILEDKAEKILAEQNLPGLSGQVVSSIFLPDHPVLRYGADGMCMELSGQVQMLYYGTEGQLLSGTARWESERQIPADSSCRMCALLQQADQPQASVLDDSIGVSCQLQMQRRITASAAVPMITELEMGERSEDGGNRPSLILRRSEGKDLWQLAKESASTVDAIRRANALEGEPEENQLLLIPVS